MRICYLSTDPGIPFGATKGGSVHIARVTTALAEEGHELLVLVPDIVPGTAPHPGVVLQSLPVPRKGIQVGARRALDDDLAAWLTDRLGELGLDVLYERFALHTSAGTRAARNAGVPHLVELNAPLLEEAARYRTLEEPDEAARLEADTLSNADVVLSVSPPLVGYAAERGARRVELLQNAADVDAFPVRRSWNEPPLAVFAGSLRPWHGVETIAAAWRLLGDEAPPLLVVGDGPARDLLDFPRARIAGAVAPADVPTLLSQADIGLAPYGRDSPRYFSPLKLFEYLAAGLATIAGDLPAVCEVVGPETAVVIPAGDPDALAAAVRHLGSDPDRRRRLGENGRGMVEAGHTWCHRARRIAELAEQLSSVGLPR